MRRFRVVAPWVLFALGCGVQPSAPPSTASAASSETSSVNAKAPGATPNAQSRLLVESWVPAVPTWPDKEYGDSELLQPIDRACPRVAAGSCAINGKDRQRVMEALASALETDSPLRRDQALAALQTCELCGLRRPPTASIAQIATASRKGLAQTYGLRSNRNSVLRAGEHGRRPINCCRVCELCFCARDFAPRARRWTRRAGFHRW